MKILRISFLNINSLAGSWTIDFESPEFRSEAFVVTGPTGAGKTSLLDAVALALYGRTARQNSFSKESNPVMSEGTADCVAEADFVGADGGRYRARWEQHRADGHADGALQKITRALYRNPCGGDPGELLESGYELATAAIEKKAGLSYDQFVRAVVLQQGDFASFLEAKKEQRADLLEKAVRDARFSEAGKKVFDAWRRAVEERRRTETILLERIGLASAGTDGKKRKPSQDDIEKRIQAANAEQEENKKSLGERRNAAEAESKSLAVEIASLQTEKNWVEAENKLRGKEADFQDRRTEVGDLEKEFAADRPVYETAVRARALDAAHAPLADARRKRGEAVSRREQYVQEKKTAEETVGKREDALADERKKKADVDTACAGKRAIIAQADAIDKKLHTAEKFVEAAKTAEKEALEAAKKSEAAAAAAEKTATRAESLAAAAAAWKPGDPVPPSFANEPVFKALAAASAADETARKEERNVEAAQRLFDKAKEKADKLREDEKKGAESELKRLLAAEEAEKKAFDGLKWALELSEQRALLKEGDTCPLCGATYHVRDVPPDLARTVADAERKWKDASTARETKETEQKAVREEEAKASRALVQAQNDLAKVRARTDQDKQNGSLELQKAATGQAGTGDPGPDGREGEDGRPQTARRGSGLFSDGIRKTPRQTDRRPGPDGGRKSGSGSPAACLRSGNEACGGEGDRHGEGAGDRDGGPNHRDAGRDHRDGGEQLPRRAGRFVRRRSRMVGRAAGRQDVLRAQGEGGRHRRSERGNQDPCRVAGEEPDGAGRGEARRQPPDGG